MKFNKIMKKIEQLNDIFINRLHQITIFDHYGRLEYIDLEENEDDDCTMNIFTFESHQELKDKINEYIKESKKL